MGVVVACYQTMSTWGAAACALNDGQTRRGQRKICGGKWARDAALLAIMVKAVAEEHAAEKVLPPAAAAGGDASMRILELSHDDEEIVVFVPKGVRTAPGPHLDANNGMSTETLDLGQVVAGLGQSMSLKGMSLSQSWHEKSGKTAAEEKPQFRGNLEQGRMRRTFWRGMVGRTIRTGEVFSISWREAAKLEAASSARSRRA